MNSGEQKEYLAQNPHDDDDRPFTQGQSAPTFFQQLLRLLAKKQPPPEVKPSPRGSRPSAS